MGNHAQLCALKHVFHKNKNKIFWGVSNPLYLYGAISDDMLASGVKYDWPGCTTTDWRMLGARSGLGVKIGPGIPSTQRPK
ncbi:hypothetical protein XELAEV_18044215mg [Xenopus laevis]|uniref:Uncharacterized protein n=1 Tax=Xenopus laevis TaxID=8355 RepID=A0A974BY38_XENLA|nr:hypothetical protein XELAEV_18044215mg [Xenopus laevis]